MLLSKKRSIIKRLSQTALLGLGLALSACQVQPLYSTNTQTGQSLANELASVQISPAKDRVEQEIRNHLIFAFTGGGEAAQPLYGLEMTTNNTAADFDIEAGSGLSTAARVSLTATYRLIQLSDKSELTKGSSFFTASYRKSTQRFANDRALRDAENRAAEQVANDIQLRLSSYFASNK
ncbi:MAG: LPS assembly lipoprotein LptE [Cohaesibacter sp.]|nr:LPS assembly lipoprotein LptE [Cohaesibacter sp.]